MTGNPLDWLMGALTVFAISVIEVLAYFWPVWSWAVIVWLLWGIRREVRRW